MIDVIRYSDLEKETWDQFNRSAKNSLFMFDRD